MKNKNLETNEQAMEVDGDSDAQEGEDDGAQEGEDEKDMAATEEDGEAGRSQDEVAVSGDLGGGKHKLVDEDLQDDTPPSNKQMMKEKEELLQLQREAL